LRRIDAPIVAKQIAGYRCRLVAEAETILKSDLSRFIAAATFAARKHRDQRRKGAEASPYINHPIAVADVLANEAGVTDVITLTAALLHDTLEDTATTAEELIEHFGAEVASVVLEVTDDKTLPKDERKRQQVLHAPAISDRAKLVKLSDKICNLRDIAASPPLNWSLARRREYFDWAREVVACLRGVNPRLEALFDAAQAGGPSGSERFPQTVQAPDRRRPS
jgi:guanosine-3',5'-bis(diphosphate) 3'-pyrophosphohydrolase